MVMRSRLMAVAAGLGSNGPQRSYSVSSGTRDYNGAVQALNSLQSNYAAVEAIRKAGAGANKQAIPQMIEWVRRIGYEPSDFDRLNPIHIAGTKGKGSTSSFISSILAQYLPTRRSTDAERIPTDVGLYTSPHLRVVRERIKINNAPISEVMFAKYFWEVWDRLEATATASSAATLADEEKAATAANGRRVDGKPLYFHFLTLMGLHCYMQENVGSAVIECGIGGEYDTTNVLRSPSVTGVASLGIDHEALLGDTIESIAWHKSGIFKAGVPAFSVPQPESAMRVLVDRAKERGTVLRQVPVHAGLAKVKLGLEGDFQKFNASLAIAVSAEHLSRLGYTGMPEPADPNTQLPTEFIVGLEAARLGGRCDSRQDTQLANLKWFIDGGHTRESIEVAGRWYAANTDGTARRVLIFNQQKRDASTLARQLYDILASVLSDGRPFSHVIFCSNTTYENAGYKPDLVSINTSTDDVSSLRVQHALAETYAQIDPSANVDVVATIEGAIVRARAIAGDGPTHVLATGSLHLVGGVIEVLEAETE